MLWGDRDKASDMRVGSRHFLNMEIEKSISLLFKSHRNQKSEKKSLKGKIEEPHFHLQCFLAFVFLQFFMS